MMRVVAMSVVVLFILSFIVRRSLETQRHDDAWLRRKNVPPYKLSFQSANVFPKVIYQTIHDKSLIPQKVHDQFNKFAPNYRRIVWDDAECYAFINKHFGKDVARRFNDFEQGCFKADLFRYCVLYINGGIYMDIKTELLRPVDECFPSRSQIYLILSHATTNDITFPIIYQGVLACPAGHPLMLSLIDFMMHQEPVFYHRYVKDCYDQFHNRFFADNRVVLYKEVCSSDRTACNGLDRYSLCCFIVDQDNNKMFKVRYNDYPWKKSK